MKQSLSILTFNWHEPYLCKLAKTGHFFDVVAPSLPRFGERLWDNSIRPLPQNVKIISAESAAAKMERNAYAAAICHNVADVAFAARFDTPIILIFHNTLTAELAIGGNTVSREDYLASIKPMLERADIKVFVSEMKKRDWELSGEVIHHGVDVSEFGPYTGNILKVLQVANLLKERSFMLDYELRKKIGERFGVHIAGRNPSIEGSAPAESFARLRSLYSESRVYMSATVYPYEDAYNMATLEAMATGAPVVCNEHPLSFIHDSFNGFVCENSEAMIERIQELYADAHLARNIGRAGRDLVRNAFPMEKFLARWEVMIESSLFLRGALV